MAISQTQRSCPACQKPTLHARHSSGAAVGCLVAIVLGLLLSVFLSPVAFFLCIGLWFLGALVETLTSPYRCQQCGKGSMTFVQGFVLVCVLAVAGMASVGWLMMKWRPPRRGAAATQAVSEPPPIARSIEINAAKPVARPIIAAQIPPASLVPVKTEPVTKLAEWQPTIGSTVRLRRGPLDCILLSNPRFLAEVNAALKELKQKVPVQDSSLKSMVDDGTVILAPTGRWCGRPRRGPDFEC